MEKRVHIIPIRREVVRAPRWKRAKRAINIIREYVQKHYRTDDVIIGKHLNEKIWERGSRKPPMKVKVVAVKTDKRVSLELEEKYEEKKEEKKTVKEKVAEALPVKKEEAVTEKIEKEEKTEL